jgi:hypothetical protein
LRASPLRAVALSKPTRLKMQATTARLMPWIPTPLSVNWLWSTGSPWEKSTIPARARMQATERPSSTSVRIDDSRISR